MVAHANQQRSVIYYNKANEQQIKVREGRYSMRVPANKFTQKDFENKFYKHPHNHDYEVVGTYERMLGKIALKHRECGYVFERTASKTTPKVYCPKCNKGHRNKKTQEIFEMEVRELVGDEYSVIGEYINTDTKVTMRHNTCLHVWDVVATSFTNTGSRCPRCAKGGIRRDNEWFIEQLVDIEDIEEYTFQEGYKGYETKLKITHNTCGHRYTVTPQKFIDGRRCPFCRESHGEKSISLYLNKRGIKYEREKVFKGLKDIYPLRYDFYISDKNVKPFLIEFDGRQHYEPVFWSQKIDREVFINSFKDIVKKDKIKDKFAKDNGINLYRIPYYEKENIDDILDTIIDNERSTTIEREG